MLGKKISHRMLFEGLTGRPNTAEKSVRELEYRSITIIQTQTKSMNKTEEIIQELWANFLWSNICIIGNLAGEERENKKTSS